jgi:hypothetical protein
MDLSKLPKLSQTSTPPNDAGGPVGGPSPAAARPDYAGPATPAYRPDGDGGFTAMDVFLSVGVGLLFVFLGMNYGKHLMGSAAAYPPITGTGVEWGPRHPKAGQEVLPDELDPPNRKAYDDRVVGRRMGIVSESSLFLFGLALILAGLLGVVGRVGAVPLAVRRGAMWVGLAATAAGLCYALYATVAMLGNGITPIMTMMSLLVGGMTLFVQAGAVRALGGMVDSGRDGGGRAGDGRVGGGRDGVGHDGTGRDRGGWVGGTAGPDAPTISWRPSAGVPAAGPSAGGATTARVPASPARQVHQRFAHEVLRRRVSESPVAVVGALQSPGGRRLLLDLWDATCRLVGTTAEATPPTGLDVETTQVGPYSAVVVTLPATTGEGEATLVGVVLRSYVRQDGAVIERQPLMLYYTLEVGKRPPVDPAAAGKPSAVAVPPPTVLCEWQGSDHVRFPDVVPPAYGAFREAMRFKVQARQLAEDRTATPP